MSEPGQDTRRRDQTIAKNEASRELKSDLRLTAWAVGLVVIVGLIVLAIMLKR